MLHAIAYYAGTPHRGSAALIIGFASGTSQSHQRKVQCRFSITFAHGGLRIAIVLAEHVARSARCGQIRARLVHAYFWYGMIFGGWGDRSIGQSGSSIEALLDRLTK